MKNLVVGFFLTFALLACLLPPAMAEAIEPQAARTLSAADRAFLASLAKMPIAATAAAKNPGEPPIGEMALCNATAYCWDGTTRYCEGNNSTASCTAVDSSCPSQRGYVTCDGVTSYCPTCECPPGWCEGQSDCEWDCWPCPYTYRCYATTCTESCRCIWKLCPY